MKEVIVRASERRRTSFRQYNLCSQYLSNTWEQRKESGRYELHVEVSWIAIQSCEKSSRRLVLSRKKNPRSRDRIILISGQSEMHMIEMQQLKVEGDKQSEAAYSVHVSKGVVVPQHL